MDDRVNRARRRLAQLGALAPALALALRAHGAPEPRVIPSGRRAALIELGYRQVQLSSGPLQRQASANHALLLNLDEDALLRPFRLRAGLPAPGNDLGGWYDTDGFAPGATFGQWMSALCRYHAISADEATRAKVLRLVAAYAASIDREGKFYRHNRFPAYIYDKLVGGLI
ncbi:MAG TPA: beta-L-arabinofuranosidase domain-containing protein, partial [Steroidobacteraceae bacterium]